MLLTPICLQTTPLPLLLASLPCFVNYGHAVTICQQVTACQQAQRYCINFSQGSICTHQRENAPQAQEQCFAYFVGRRCSSCQQPCCRKVPAVRKAHTSVLLLQGARMHVIAWFSPLGMRWAMSHYVCIHLVVMSIMECAAQSNVCSSVCSPAASEQLLTRCWFVPVSQP